MPRVAVPVVLFALVASLAVYRTARAQAGDDERGPWGDPGLTTAFHGIRSLGLDDAFARAVEREVARALEGSQGLHLTIEDLMAAETCARDLACHCARAREQRAARVLFANVGHIDRLYTLEVVLLDTQACDVENAVFVSEQHEPASALARMRTLVQEVTVPRSASSRTASKDTRDEDAVPATVTVFTDKQIRQLGITDLSELFQLVPGFESLDANWGDILLHQGLPATVLFLIDGVPLTHGKHNVCYLSRDLFLSLNSVERVEFVRGPGSVLWGKDALLGIVNVITKRPFDELPRAEVHLRGGTYPTGEVFARIEQAQRLFSYSVSATARATRGPQSFVEDGPYASLHVEEPVWGNTGTTRNDADTYLDVHAQVSLWQRLVLRMSLFHLEDRYQVSLLGSLMTEDTGGLWRKTHRIYSAEWSDNLPLGFRYQLIGSRYEYVSWEEFAIHPPHPEGHPNGLRSLQGHETVPEATNLVEGRLYHEGELGFAENRAILGASYTHLSLADSWATLTDYESWPATQVLSYRGRSTHNVAAFAQDELWLWRWIGLTGGVRFEMRDALPVLSKQAALLLRAPVGNVKLMYAEGFRTPPSIYLYSTVGTEGNPALRPELSRALSLEGSADLTLGPTVRVTLGGAAMEVQDLITLDTQNKSEGFAYKPINQGSIGILSGYAEAHVEWSTFLSGFLSYSYKLLAESDPVGEGIPVAPHTASLGATVRPMNDVSLFCTASYLSPREVAVLTPTGTRAETIGRTLRFSAGALISNVVRGFDLGLKLTNPLLLSHQTPYNVDGNASPLLETRDGSEIVVTLRWTGDLDVDGWTATIAPAGARPTPTPRKTFASDEQPVEDSSDPEEGGE